MNHAEWKRKVKAIEERIRVLSGFDKLGPVQLVELEDLIVEVEKFLEVRV